MEGRHRCACGWEGTILEFLDHLTDVRDDYLNERDRYIRAFNRLEKAVTDHLKDCFDPEALAHVHKVVMRDLTEKRRG